MTAGPSGLLIAAPASGSGKTTVTLALLRHLRNLGHRVSSVKTGPDYIDPGFHEAASGRPCFNLDPWAMRPETMADALALAGRDSDLVIGEGVMGLFDGAVVPDDRGLAGGSTASLAAAIGWPVVLVVDCKGMAASLAALLRGFASHHREVVIAGVILNAVASDRHEGLLRDACRVAGLPVLAALRRCDALERPSRHLGLVQAGEDAGLERFLDLAAETIGRQLDEAALLGLARPARSVDEGVAAEPSPPLAPLGQHIAVARDVAFAFCYPLLLAAWRRAGVEVSFFSPLGDEPPAAEADAVYLPGGYPELHAEALANNQRFRAGLHARVARGATVYGECGGYMVLGRGLEDAEGKRHEMLGLLPIETSLKRAKRKLGYCRAQLLDDGSLGPKNKCFRAHEFHYATIEDLGGDALFDASLADGSAQGSAGHREGSVMGSFLHLIDGEVDEPEIAAGMTRIA